MQTLSALSGVFGVLIALFAATRSALVDSWRDRQAVHVDRLQSQASVPGLRAEAQEALLHEARSTTLWLLAQRKYPQEAALSPPLLTLAILAPACLAASFPLGMSAGRLVLSTVLWAGYIGAGLWMLNRIVRSEADSARWKLYQLTGGYEIKRICPPKFLSGLLKLLWPAHKGVAVHVQLLQIAYAMQHADEDGSPERQRVDDVDAWELVATRIDPEYVNAAIEARN